MQQNDEALFVERLSLPSLAIALLLPRKARIVYFIHETRMAEGLIGLLGRFGFPLLAPIRKLDYVDLLGSFYDTMEESYQRVNDGICDLHRQNLYQRIAIAFCGREEYETVLRKEMLIRYTWKRVKTLVFLSDISRKYRRVIFLPLDDLEVMPLLSPRFHTGGGIIVPAWYRLINRMNTMARVGGFAAIFPLLLGAVMVKEALRGITLRKSHRVRFTYGLDMQSNGLLRERGYDPETRKFFLYDEADFHPSRVLHMVRYGHRLEPGAAGMFREFGAPYVELDRIRFPLSFFLRRVLLDFTIKGLGRWAGFLKGSMKGPLYVFPALALMKMKVDAELELEHFDVKVFISRDEYSPYHIVRTLVAHEHDNRTIGFQWGELYYHGIIFSHMVFDVYALWGEFYREFHRKGLAYSRTEIIGADIYGSDSVFRYLRENDIAVKYKELKKKFTIVAIMGSGWEPGSSITKGPAVQFHEDVLNATDKYDNILRVRKPKGDFIDQELAELMKGRPNVILEKELTTPRFMVVPDLIIVQSVSSLMLEALMAGKRVLSYSFVTPPAYSIYSRYSPYLVAFTKEELSRNLDRILSEGAYVDEGILDRIREQHGFRFDGKVVDRFRGICRSLLKEAKAKDQESLDIHPRRGTSGERGA
jgi:hypothetical protein